MSAFTTFVSNLPVVDVIHGVAYDDSLGDRVKVTILAAGFEMSTATGIVIDEAANVSTAGVPAAVEQKSDVEDPTVLDVVKKEYGQEQVAAMQAQQARNLYVVLTMSQLDDDRIIEGLEKYPAYKRTKEMKARIFARPDAADPQQRPAVEQHHAASPSESRSGVINIDD